MCSVEVILDFTKFVQSAFYNTVNQLYISKGHLIVILNFFKSYEDNY